MAADGGVPHFKDPAIKLFGRKIALPDSQIPARPELKTNSCNKDEKTNMEIERPSSEGNSKEPDQSSTCQETAERGNCDGQVKEAQNGSKDDQMESSSDQEKAMKKPDKVIPCPRCNSLETKFCYFNNYNVNQPRHFCKNCQRYWTAGGTMRNVPVGAGRRKNKHLASQYRQIMVSHDGMSVTRVETHDQQPPEPATASMSCSPSNGMVLKFGPDQAPLCESMQNVNLGDGGDTTSCGPPSMDETPENVEHKKDQVDSSAHSKDPNSSAAHHHPMQCFPVAPLIVPWSWNSVASTDPNQVQWCPTTPMLAVPGFSPPGVPLHFLPASYLSCMPVWPNGCHSPSSSSTSCSSGNGTPTLGKHCRDTSLDDEEKVEKSIVIPKTLRIDDPNEALRSPLWSALGLKQEPGVLVTKGSIFKTFQSKGEGKVPVQESAHILEANPAALSRSQTFQEGS
ncbi:unnamed protein product [Linum tenue]|uniref:Dof-type domain-containing protein n=1 Tax=Linum tenue TaxID=586396 RepID=A0AAV0LHL0_9ROSI|nr:unnamed protein product [Linum tenue]